jgi:NADH:ubiquinone oxidoreductase subunit 2 (subunit N)
VSLPPAILAMLAPAPLAALGALLCSGLLLTVDRRGHGPLYALAPLVVLLPLAAAVAGRVPFTHTTVALLVALVIAILARDRDELLQNECAIKLLWVMSASLVLSGAGEELLILVTGTPRVLEQWGVLAIGIDAPYLWSVALPLSLLAGMVMLGGAPFNFWTADLLQGARPWAAPLAVAALQVTGAAWIAHRLEGIEVLPAANAICAGLLGVGAATALVVGAATLIVQRRPERRVGTLVSLHGGLALALLLVGRRAGDPGWFAAWAAHQALAITGASVLARFLPVAAGPADRGGALFRRHPWTGLAGWLATASLAGVPGTPGAWLWLRVARALATTGHLALLLALVLAWLAAFAAVMRQAHEALGVHHTTPAPARSVPWQARLTLWITALGLLAQIALGWTKR